MTSVPQKSPAAVERQLRMAASLMRARPDLKEQVVSDLVEGEWLGVVDAMRWASALTIARTPVLLEEADQEQKSDDPQS